MRGKRVFYCELAYVLGIIILALGTAFMEKADFGMSMVVAPAYLLHLKVSEFIPFFSFGMAEYVFQAFLLCIVSIVMGKVKKSYFLSFVTAIIYGFVLDIMIDVVSFLSLSAFIWRVIFYLLGMVTCSVGVALLLHTYFPPEAYEIMVKEFSKKFNLSLGKTKTIYDYSSCILGIVLSLVFFGSFVGVSLGTVICALVNGWLIGRVSYSLNIKFIFKDALPLREKLK